MASEFDALLTATKQPSEYDDLVDYASKVRASSQANLAARNPYAGAPGISALNTYGVKPTDKPVAGPGSVRMAIENAGYGLTDPVFGAGQLLANGVQLLANGGENNKGAIAGTANGVINQREQELRRMQLAKAQPEIVKMLNDPEFQQLAKDDPGFAQSKLDGLVARWNPVRVASGVAVPAAVGAKVAGPINGVINQVAAPASNALIRGGAAAARLGMRTAAGTAAGGLVTGSTPIESTSEEDYANKLSSALKSGLLWGAGTSLGSSLISGLLGAGEQAARPLYALTDNGAKKEAGNIISRQLKRDLPPNTTPIITPAASNIQGYTNSLTEATLNPEIASIQKQFARELDPSNQQNIAALHANLKRMGASDEEIAQMFKDRSLMDKGNYDAAFGSEEKYRQNAADAARLRADANKLTGSDVMFKGQPDASIQRAASMRKMADVLDKQNELSGLSGTSADTVSPGMQQLLSDPQMARVVKAAQQDMHSLGIPGDITSMRGMHFMKMALDDMKQAGYSPTGSSMDAINGKVLQSFSDKLNADLNANPMYQAARKQSADAAKKIDAALVSNRIIQKAGNAPTSPTTGQPNAFSDSGLRSALGDERALIKKTTGYGGPSSLADILNADQNIPRNKILQDTLGQSARAQEANRLMGLTGRADTNAIPSAERSTSHMMLPLPMRIPLKLADILGAGANDKIKNELVNALRDPEIAKDYMKRANSITDIRKLRDFLDGYSSTAIPAAAGSTQNKRN